MENNINPMEVSKSIEELNRIVVNMKEVFKTLDTSEYNPFICVTYDDILELKNRLIPMLSEYEDILNAYINGDILINMGNYTMPGNPSSLRSGENAPAYKKNINEEKMYKLYKDGVSLRQIAKQVGCSPDTVKKRIYKMKQRERNR